MSKKFFLRWMAAWLMPMFVQTGCNKLIEVPSNAGGQVVTSQVFADSMNATQGVLGLYTSPALSAQFPDIYTGLGGDELLPNSADPLGRVFYIDSLYAGRAYSLLAPTAYIWGTYYGTTAIYQANAALEGLTADSLLSASARNQLVGECTFVRALYYFYLVNLFGDVPYITGTSVKEIAHMPRTAAATIYSEMERDLLKAASLLRPAYPTRGRLRPNRYTADALLARLYLYRRQWQQAQSLCDSIINSGLYALQPDPDDVFLDNSSEAIWQLGSYQPYSPMVAPGYTPFLPLLPGSTPAYSLSPLLLNVFDSGDLRRQKWVGAATVITPGGPVTYIYSNKYKNTEFYNPNNTTEDLMVFRLAEIYLIRAEARARQGNLAGAVQDVNLIRIRAGLTGAATPASFAEAMALILHERQVELFTEWGHRWLDLKRTDSINAVLGREKPKYWAPDGHDALFPIPDDEIIANPSLTQNPGY